MILNPRKYSKYFKLGTLRMNMIITEDATVKSPLPTKAMQDRFMISRYDHEYCFINTSRIERIESFI